MKNLFGSMIALSVLLSACSSSFSPTAKAQTESTPEQVISVEAEGKLMPDPAIELAFGQSGIVAEVYVQAGDKVASDQVLARLVGSKNADADVSAAQAALMQSQQALTEMKRRAMQNSGEAELAFRQARKEYVKVSSGWTVGNEDDATELELAIDDYKEAEDDFFDAWEEVIDLLGKNDSNQKRMDAEEDYKRFEDTLNDTYADLHEVTGSQVYPIEEKPAKILAAIGVYEQTRALQARLNNDGLDPEQLILAEAAVSSMENNLTAAKERAEYYLIRAPFSGQVVSVEPMEGETFLAGTPAIYLADPTEWIIETIDLAEVDILMVKPGQVAQVELDGLPGEVFSAHVSEIDLIGREYLGDITFTVTLTMDQTDPRFMWNMTAVVSIETE